MGKGFPIRPTNMFQGKTFVGHICAKRFLGKHRVGTYLWGYARGYLSGDIFWANFWTFLGGILDIFRGNFWTFLRGILDIFRGNFWTFLRGILDIFNGNFWIF